MLYVDPQTCMYTTHTHTCARSSHLLVANVGKSESVGEGTADDTGLKEMEAPGGVFVGVSSVLK